MAPNSTRSSPVKFEVTITRWFDSDATSRSAAAGRRRERRPARRERSDGAIARIMSRSPRGRIEYRSSGVHHQLEREAQADREHQQAEQQAQPLAAHLLSGARAELRADHAADHQDQRQHRVDQVVGRGVHHRRRRHGDEREHHRGADHRRGRHAQEIDQHRHQQEAAADAHDRADEADDEADRPDRNGGHVDLRALEAQLERQPVNPGVAAGPAQLAGLPWRARMIARTLSSIISAPTMVSSIT